MCVTHGIIVCCADPTNHRTQVVLGEWWVVRNFKCCVNGPTNHRTQVVHLGERVHVLCVLNAYKPWYLHFFSRFKIEIAVRWCYWCSPLLWHRKCKHRNSRVLKSVSCFYIGLKITPDSANRWVVGWALVHVHGTFCLMKYLGHEPGVCLCCPVLSFCVLIVFYLIVKRIHLRRCFQMYLF